MAAPFKLIECLFELNEAAKKVQAEWESRGGEASGIQVDGGFQDFRRRLGDALTGVNGILDAITSSSSSSSSHATNTSERIQNHPSGDSAMNVSTAATSTVRLKVEEDAQTEVMGMHHQQQQPEPIALPGIRNASARAERGEASIGIPGRVSRDSSPSSLAPDEEERDRAEQMSDLEDDDDDKTRSYPPNVKAEENHCNNRNSEEEAEATALSPRRPPRQIQVLALPAGDLQGEHEQASNKKSASASMTTRRTSTRAAANRAIACMSSPSFFRESPEESNNEDDIVDSALDESNELAEEPRQGRRPKRKAESSVAQRESAAPRKARSASKGGMGRDEKWLAKYNELCRYKAEHGHCLVPNRYEHNPQLGNWVKKQRENYRLLNEGKPYNSMSKDRIKQLNDIGFTWVAR